MNLPDRWRERAAELRRYGAEPQAVALEACADELEAEARRLDGEEITLDEAAEIARVSRRTIERRIERGHYENVGEEGKPRVRLRDVLPDAPRLVEDTTAVPDVIELLRTQV